MEAAMVSAFSGAMGSVLSKLAGLLEKDFKLARGVKEDIVSLRDEMSTINASLMELSQMEEPIDDLHRELRAKVRELAYDMEDCLDISMHRLGDPSKAGFLRELKSLRARCEIAKLISALKARVAQLGNRHKLILQLPERPRAVCVDPRIQALYQDPASLQGIGGHKEKVVEELQDGAPQLKVVSILGTGGIGKTTLANQVYTAIQGKFDCTAFVSVSRIPDFAKIFSDIIQQSGWYSISQDDNEIISRLRRRLQNVRYLIVIDDMWTIGAWNTIKSCFVENNCGSRVITTTRIEDTAKSCSSSFHGYVYRMEPLNDVDSRILFHKRIFHSEDGCPQHLKCVSNEILKKCGGLPLAILTIGSILANHQDVGSTEIWEKIVHSFRFQMERSPAFEWLRHVFNLGYNDLSLELKTCMLYLGIFPEDCKIVKDDLLRRWIAEGFVTEKHGDIQEEIAESYFNELINRNMIQIAEFDDCGEVFSCRVHDLLLDYIIIKCTDQNFVTIVNDQQSTKGPLDVRRLSLHVKHSSERNGVLENMALTQARSFNFCGPAQWLPSLTKFRLLRVLNLDINGSMDRRYDMSCIHSLFQLRYLRTNGIGSNKKLLTQLRKLEQLKTLEVAREDGYFVLDAQMLPSTLWHLNLPAVVKLAAGGIGHLTNLRTLSEFEIELRDVGRMKELGELTNLRELKLLGSYGVGDTSEVLLSSLCKLVCLRSIVIRRSLVEEDVLARWSPPPRHLRRLHVLECLFSTIPADWITHLHNLSSLEIEVRSLPSDGIVVLARLTLLVHLKLHVKEHVPREGFVVFHRVAFPNLRELWFRWEEPCLVFEAGTMPRLRSLVIDCYAKGARQADGVLDGIQHLGSLVEFKVHVYEREGYISWMLLCADLKSARVEEQRRWDKTSLKAALKEAISKHPGSLRVVIKYM
ncbi:disease resistance protein RGA5-like [Miscanthus floridulus]|uniref:disease resistance protein RGA5-like n=1 Tax=Miscanthus floridulus TaxID=154761 RepID=UPI003457B9AB